MMFDQKHKSIHGNYSHPNHRIESSDSLCNNKRPRSANLTAYQLSVLLGYCNSIKVGF
jgi:hypothetical protein